MFVWEDQHLEHKRGLEGTIEEFVEQKKDFRDTREQGKGFREQNKDWWNKTRVLGILFSVALMYVTCCHCKHYPPML